MLNFKLFSTKNQNKKILITKLFIMLLQTYLIKLQQLFKIYQKPPAIPFLDFKKYVFSNCEFVKSFR